MFSFFKRKNKISALEDRAELAHLRIDVLFELLLSLIRIQMIHPDLIAEKSGTITENTKLMDQIIASMQKKKGNE
jgi:hypothetical protein